MENNQQKQPSEVFCKNKVSGLQAATLLTLSWLRPLSYRTQSIDLLRKSMDWFLFDNGLRHEMVNRKQIVVLNGQNSTWTNVHARVSQRSILGPLLFLIYIID